MAVRTFTEVCPPAEREPDRPPWKPGEVIAVTGIVISTKTRFKKIAKVNGIDPKTDQFIKRRTTSEPAVKKLENLLMSTGAPDGRILGDPVLCKLVEKRGRPDPVTKKTMTYFDIADPGKD
jgi:hypothetical protein